MDSKNIYIAAQHTTRIVSWQGAGDDGWTYVGDGRNFDMEKAQAAIDSFFDEEIVYLSVDRHNGFEVQTSKAGWELQKYIEKGAWLVNASFKKVIVFSNVGVYRCGQVNS